MKDIPRQTIDLIVADPPFGIAYVGARDEWWDKSQVTEYAEVHVEDYPVFTEKWIKKAYRLLKNEGTMYVVSGWNNLECVLRSVREMGLCIQSHVIWHYTRPQPTQRRFATSHYHILHTTKHPNKYTFNKGHYPIDVWIRQRERWSGRVKKTLTKLPVDIVSKMVTYSSNVEELVFDPFMGSGTTGVVAKRYNRHFLGFEIVEETWKMAKERIDSSPWGVGDFFE